MWSCSGRPSAADRIDTGSKRTTRAVFNLSANLGRVPDACPRVPASSFGRVAGSQKPFSGRWTAGQIRTSVAIVCSFSYTPAGFAFGRSPSRFAMLLRVNLHITGIEPQDFVDRPRPAELCDLWRRKPFGALVRVLDAPRHETGDLPSSRLNRVSSVGVISRGALGTDVCGRPIGAFELPSRAYFSWTSDHLHLSDADLKRFAKFQRFGQPDDGRWRPSFVTVHCADSRIPLN